MHLQNAYGYPSSYNYNGGIGYQYNWGQNTKDQMEAYSKLVLASYQNGQQFCSPNIQQYTQQQQHALNNTLSTTNNVQTTQHETSNPREEIGNDNTKVDESSTVSDNSSITTTSSEPHTPVPNSTTLPSPGNISTNNQDSPNNSLTAPSSNPCTTSPNENHQGTVNSSQLYSPMNSFGNWQTSNFPYTADNPYAAYYNNPNLAAMYNQSMTMGGHHQPSYFTGGSVQQQPDSTTSGNMNRGWAQNAAQNTATAYPFHPTAATSAFVSPFSDPAAALYNNYASLWNTHHNTGQFIYGNTLHPSQANVNGFVSNLSSMNDKMKQYCDNQQQQQQQQTQQAHLGDANSTQIKSLYNDHITQSQDDKLQPATTTVDDHQNVLNDSSSPFSIMGSSNNQPLDLELTYRNNPELAEKLRQVSLKKPRVTFSIKQVVELEKEFHSSR